MNYKESLQKARKQLAIAAVDTERLDWLGSQRCSVGRYRSGEWGVQEGILELGRGATLREAIDAAMNGEQAS